MATNTRKRDDAVAVLNRQRSAGATIHNALLDLQRVMGTAPIVAYNQTGRTMLRFATDNPVGSVRWVSAFGRQRRGIVVKVTKTKATVAYVVPTSPDDLKVATEQHLRVTEEPLKRATS